MAIEIQGVFCNVGNFEAPPGSLPKTKDGTTTRTSYSTADTSQRTAITFYPWDFSYPVFLFYQTSIFGLILTFEVICIHMEVILVMHEKLNAI